jgi:hypothetical protein
MANEDRMQTVAGALQGKDPELPRPPFEKAAGRATRGVNDVAA